MCGGVGLPSGASSPGSTSRKQCDLCHHLTSNKIKDVKTRGSAVPLDVTRPASFPGCPLPAQHA